MPSHSSDADGRRQCDFNTPPQWCGVARCLVCGKNFTLDELERHHNCSPASNFEDAQNYCNDLVYLEEDAPAAVLEGISALRHRIRTDEARLAILEHEAGDNSDEEVGRSSEAEETKTVQFMIDDTPSTRHDSQSEDEQEGLRRRRQQRKRRSSLRFADRYNGPPMYQIQKHPTTGGLSALRSKEATVAAKQAIESLSYVEVVHDGFVRESKSNSSRENKTALLQRLERVFSRGSLSLGFFTVLIGALVGSLTFLIMMATWQLRDFVGMHTNRIVESEGVGGAFGAYVCVCLLCVLSTAALVVLLHAGRAKASGVPLMMAFLNGVKVPGMFGARVLIVKMLGLIFILGVGLPFGAEGPLFHIGGMVGDLLYKLLKLVEQHAMPGTRHLRLVNETRRLFIATASAAGVSAGFNAPITGVLLSMSEGISFWTESITYLCFVSGVTSSIVVLLLLNVYQGNVGNVQLKVITIFEFDLRQEEQDGVLDARILLLLPILLGTLGGLLAGALTSVNCNLDRWRRTLSFKVQTRRLLLEVVILGVLTCSANCFLPIITGCLSNSFNYHCEQDGNSPPLCLQWHCPKGEHSPLASLFFASPELAVNWLFNDRGTINASLAEIGGTSVIPIDEWECFIFGVTIFSLVSVFYGCSVPAGLFVPACLLGATGSRLVGLLLFDAGDIDLGAMAMIGATAVVAGLTRNTLATTAMFVEMTGNIQMSPAIILSAVLAKKVADVVSDSIYDEYLRAERIPMVHDSLHKEVELMTKTARDVMSSTVNCVNQVAEVGHVFDLLVHTKHHAFPCVIPVSRGKRAAFLGLLSRETLLDCIRSKIFFKTKAQALRASKNIGYTPANDAARGKRNSLWATTRQSVSVPFVSASSETNIGADISNDVEQSDSISILPHHKHMLIDFTNYVDSGVFVVQETTNLARIARMFRNVGVRHLVVINNFGMPVGMITRQDIVSKAFFTRSWLVSSGELEQTPFFNAVNAARQHELVMAMNRRELCAGEVLIKQGHGDVESNNFYILCSGECQVLVNGVEVRRFSKNFTMIGESALLHTRHASHRSATVKATTRCVLLELQRHDYESIVPEKAQIGVAAESASRLQKRIKKSAVKKLETQLASIEDKKSTSIGLFFAELLPKRFSSLVSRSSNISTFDKCSTNGCSSPNGAAVFWLFQQLGCSASRRIVQHGTRHVVASGQCIISNSLPAETLYIVTVGTAEVWLSGVLVDLLKADTLDCFLPIGSSGTVGGQSFSKIPQIFSFLRKGPAFSGHGPSSANPRIFFDGRIRVIASGEVECLVVGRDVIQAVLGPGAYGLIKRWQLAEANNRLARAFDYHSDEVGSMDLISTAANVVDSAWTNSSRSSFSASNTNMLLPPRPPRLQERRRSMGSIELPTGWEGRSNELSLSEKQIAKSIPLFRALPFDQVKALLSAMEDESFSPGQTICTETEPSDSLYIIITGYVIFSVNGYPINQVKLEGVQHFGSVELLRPVFPTTTPSFTVTAYSGPSESTFLSKKIHESNEVPIRARRLSRATFSAIIDKATRARLARKHKTSLFNIYTHYLGLLEISIFILRVFAQTDD